MLAPFGLEHVVNEWLEVRQRSTDVVAIKCWPVILCAELFCVIKIFSSTELLACIFVKTDVVPEVVALENSVMLHHPPVGFGDEWLQDARSDVWVVERRKVVANVVDE